MVAASLALWGIFTQVSVAKRSLEHQRDVDENRAWWSRFEWAATRAVPRSRDEVPLPYNAVLSTLTGLTETANDDVQRRAISAIIEVAASTGETAQEPTGQSRITDDLRLTALQKYAEAAGDTAARSSAVEGQLYGLSVIEALRRVLPESAVNSHSSYKGGPNSAIVKPDAVVFHKGRKIVVEVKNYRKTRSLHPGVLRSVATLITAANADAAILVTPIELPVGNQTVVAATAVWNSSNDDENLLSTLNQVVDDL